MDLKEQNWNNFCAKHLQDWHGIWTIYSPSGEVTDSYQCVRSFRSDREQTEITHTNRYTYADGRREEKTWQLYKPSLRAIFFEQGAGAYNSQQLEPGTLFAVELFFRYEDIRHSVVAAYQDVDTPQPKGVRILRSMIGLKSRTLPHLTQRSNLPKRLRCLATKFRHDLPYLFRD